MQDGLQRREDTAVGTERDGAGVSDRAVGLWTLAVGLAISGFLLWKNHTDMWFEEYYLLNTMMLLWPPLLLITVVLRREISEFGMVAGDLKRGAMAALIGFLLFIPVMAFAARTPDAQQYYLGVLLGSRPYGSGAVQGLVMMAGGAYRGGVIDPGRLCFHEAVFGFYMFAWEWFFRGFLLNGLRRAFPVWLAIGIQAVLFCALHWGKPVPELCSSLAGGVLLGIVSLRYRSFLPCFLIHWAISVGFDIAILYFHFHP